MSGNLLAVNALQARYIFLVNFDLGTAITIQQAARSVVF
jgi:hypothetical protein